MQIQSQYTGTAPLATGHPHGVPDPRRAEKPQTRVLPIELARDPEATLSRGQTPAGFWRAVGGEPDPEQIAPPSIMQIRISRLLDAQRDTPAEPASPAPQENQAPQEKQAAYSIARNSVFSTLP